MKIILSVLIFILVLTSCSQVGKSDGSVENNYYSTYNTHTDLIEESKSIYLTQKDKNLISVQIPILDTNNFYTIKNNIVRYIGDYLFNLTDIEFQISETNNDLFKVLDENVAQYDYYIDINYRIAMESKDCISIIFEGMLNNRMAAHPIHLFFTYNVNPKTCERIVFSDMYHVDENLYNIVLLDVKEKIGDERLENLLDEKSFLNGLSNEKDVFSYYTKDFVGISVPVPFSLGNHIEAEIPYNALRHNT